MTFQPTSLLRSPRAVITGSIIAALLMGALLVALDYRERDQRAWVDHTSDVIDSLNAIHRIALEGESSVRGYRLNGSEENLLPYRQAVADIEPQLALLRTLTSDSATQAAAAASLTELVHEKFAVLKDALEAGLRANEPTASPDRVTRGMALMTQIRSVLEKMESTERRLLSERQQNAEMARRQIQLVIGFLFLSAVTLAGFAIRSSMVRERDQRSAKQAIEESESRYRLLADNATDIISLRDLTTDKMTYFSPAVTMLLGWVPDELLGDRWIALVHPEDRESFLLERAKYRKRNDHPAFQFRMQHKDGHYLWIDKRASFIGGDSDFPQLSVSTWRDVSERKHAEDEAVHLRLVAEEANRAKSDFLAMMSHELRTPMAGVLGIADLVLMGDLAEDQTKLMHQLRRSALSLLDILNDILDFSKIEAGKLEIDEHAFSLGDILTDVRALFAPVASKKGITFEIDITQGVADALNGDANRLRQVIVNLVNNAIKFTKFGRIDLRVRQKPLDDGRVLIEVEVVDTGIGMTPEVKERLFQPFVQAGPVASRKFGGTGLGLAISRRLVAAMGGEISVESEVGRGSRFTFSLPMTVAPDALSSGPRQERRSQAVRSMRPLHLLLAEDTETVRLVVATMLRKMGHTVVEVTDGSLAVREAQVQQFDAILMDMQMPVMDGIEATKAIRTFSKVPIIALTADAIPEHREIYIGVGVNGVVTKPVNWELLTTKLARFVPDVAVPSSVERRKEIQGPPSILNERMIGQLTRTMGVGPIAKIFLTFENSLGGYQRELVDAVNAGDLKLAKKVAHSLKGIAAQVGADKLAAHAATIEIDAQSIEQAEAEMGALTEAADQTLTALIQRRNTQD